MSTSSNHYLEVFLSTGTKVGEITKSRTTDNHYLFSYTREWKQRGFPISPFIPLDGEASSESVKNFLWNLLPEGRELDELCYFKSISKFDVLAALSEMGLKLPVPYVLENRRTLIKTWNFRQLETKNLLNDFYMAISIYGRVKANYLCPEYKIRLI
jgi:serine/threonine-protein kinase HipA